MPRGGTRPLGTMINWRGVAETLAAAYPTWGAGGGIVVALVIGSALSGGRAEDAVRFTGTILQLFGVALVAFGLSELRRFFGQPSFAQKVAGWFGRLSASLRPRTVSATAAFIDGAASLRGVVRVVRNPAPGAPVESRVTLLEENLNQLRDELDAKEQQLQRDVDILRERIDQEGQERRSREQQLEQKIREVGVGGLNLEYVGLVWVLLGSLATNIPDKIAASWQRIVGLF